MLAHSAIKLENFKNFYNLLPDFEFDEKKYEISLRITTSNNEISFRIFEHIIYHLKEKYRIKDEHIFKINIEKKICSKGAEHIMFWIDKIHDGLSHY